jgi:hypothetical protein
MFIFSSGLTTEKTPPSTVPLAYHKKVGDYFFQELHVKLVETVGFETPDRQIGHFNSMVVNAQLQYSKD